jgi:hypothetical protein
MTRLWWLKRRAQYCRWLYRLLKRTQKAMKERGSTAATILVLLHYSNCLTGLTGQFYKQPPTVTISTLSRRILVDLSRYQRC